MTNEYDLYIKQVACDKYITCIINAVSKKTNDIVISSVNDNYSQDDAKQQLLSVITSLRKNYSATAVTLVEE